MQILASWYSKRGGNRCSMYWKSSLNYNLIFTICSFFSILRSYNPAILFQLLIHMLRHTLLALSITILMNIVYFRISVTYHLCIFNEHVICLRTSCAVFGIAIFNVKLKNDTWRKISQPTTNEIKIFLNPLKFIK